MIRPAQRKLLDRAREAAASDPTEFAELMRRYGGTDRVEELTAAGLARLLDHLTVTTRFRSRQRPILSTATHKRIREAADALALSPFVYEADLRGFGGAADLRDFTGRGLINLLSRWERRGLRVAEFVAARREIKPAQLRLLQIARKQVGIEDERYYGMLQDYGGVVSAGDLDRRGLDLCMAFMAALGFERASAAPAAPGFGHRPGFASPEQVELIRSLWREWTGPSAESAATIEAGLNVWLERYHGASSLRFLTKAGAARAITALKAMKGRKSAARHLSFEARSD